MAPRRQSQANKAVAKTAKNGADAAEAAKVQTLIDELRQHASSTALAQLFYVILRMAWHFWLPQHLGAQPFVPLVLELVAAEITLFLLFRSGGGFGPASLERPWVLNLYAILSVGVLGKCATDCYVLHYAPALWQHYDPSRPWGVPSLLASRLAGTVPLQPAQIESVLKFLEVSGDSFFLLTIFRGIRTGKALILARRKLAKLTQQRKDD